MMKNFKMNVGFDEKSSLFQLTNFPDPKKMFDEKLCLFSGTSNYMKSYFEKFADQIKFKLKAKLEKRLLK